jgi:L-lactate dehydrogenase complex protein LldG
VLERAALVAHLEDVWEKVRAVGGMPRALNIISGPSRTADVEQTIQLGAHGPRRVLIVISG